ncbi:hypothetical protein [Nonomuraea sp. PA05]|uniref:hypothetical protein n=1 Tax=Nonomuraea sp. PA05 TaxID=2604466 RepID=UPI00165257BB|nr:hypothetical protein [Nonomuraea sp. PA05]
MPDVTVPDWLLQSALSSWRRDPSLCLEERMRAVLVDALTEYRIVYGPEEG